MHVTQRTCNNGQIWFIINKIKVPSSQKNIQNIVKDEVKRSGKDGIKKYFKPDLFPASSQEHDCIYNHRINNEYPAPERHEAHQNNYDGRIAEINLIDICKVINRRMEKDDQHKCQTSQQVKRFYSDITCQSLISHMTLISLFE